MPHTQTAREVRQFIRQLKDAGYSVSLRRNHWQCIPPGCTQGFVTIPTSPSDWRWKLNAAADVKRLERRMAQAKKI